MQDQLSSMRREMAEEREEADEHLTKRLRLEKKTNFKRKGNERQFDINEQVREKMERAAGHLSGGTPDVEKAKKALKEGEELITERQK